MRLFKSSLYILLVIGTLNSCTKDEETGNNDTSNNKDSMVNSGYSVAVVNSFYKDYSYTLSRPSSNIEEFDVIFRNNDPAFGEIRFNNSGKPTMILRSIDFDEADTVQVKYLDRTISEIITSNHIKEEYESNWKLLQSSDNQYIYGIIIDNPNEPKQIIEGVKIDIYPDFDSIHVVLFDSYDGVIDEDEDYGFKYVKSVKTSYAINCFNFTADFDNFDTDPESIHWIVIANILENMGATYFFGGSDNDYKITFNDNKLPVRVDHGPAPRVWTAIYQ